MIDFSILTQNSSDVKSLVATPQIVPQGSEGFLGLANNLKELEKNFINVVVEDEKSLQVANEKMAELRILWRNVEKKRKALLAPYTEITGEINQFSNELKGKIKALTEPISNNISNFLLEKERKEQEEHRKKQEELRKIEEEHRKKQEFLRQQAEQLAKEAADAEKEKDQTKMEAAREKARQFKREAEKTGESLKNVMTSSIEQSLEAVEPEIVATPMGKSKLEKKTTWEIEDLEKVLKSLPKTIIEERKKALIQALTPAFNQAVRSSLTVGTLQPIEGLRIVEVRELKTVTKRS